MNINNSWKEKVNNEFGKNLIPKENENWEQLYNRINSSVAAQDIGEALENAAGYKCERKVQELIFSLGDNIPNKQSILQNTLDTAIMVQSKEIIDLLFRLDKINDKLNISLSSLKQNPLLLSEIIEKGPVLSKKLWKTVINDIYQDDLDIRILNIFYRSFPGCINMVDDSGKTAINSLLNAAYLKYAKNHPVPVSKFLKKIEWLLQRGAHVNIPDRDGITPLHYACAIGDLRFLELLAANEANLFAKDKNGNNCIAWGLLRKDPNPKRSHEPLALDLQRFNFYLNCATKCMQFVNFITGRVPGN